ncbi:hypothetical protein BGZ65_004961 [Modicella reniformis]|uniref:Mitochondrial import inner membrane translocase subunit TIM50 n=1 Tax=Modicella reniformis TaxID=1440133 RepID=A0A9P6MGY7_9FUNG|nr:hypothetical protein BGZ65_004961 [Modicella reniformis]
MTSDYSFRSGSPRDTYGSGWPTSSSKSHPIYYDEARQILYPSNPIRAITPSYLIKAREEPITMITPQKLLVILDLNGTLFYRARRNRAVTSRPYLTQFLDFLFNHCRVMVWSSARPHSVENMLSSGFGARVSKLDRIWNREHFQLPENDYIRNVLTIKDLEFVWDDIARDKSDTVHASGGGNSNEESIEFDQTNTILIDDSTAKIQLQPYNGVALRDFDEELAKVGTDNELLKVKKYLEKLIYQANVSAYMRLHPFSSRTPLSPDPARGPVEAETTRRAEDELADELNDLTRHLERNSMAV